MVDASRRLLFVAGFVGALLVECTMVPDIEPTVESIPIYRIVERVKCEVLYAMKGPLGEAAYSAAHHRRSRYAFLDNWTAKVDLTLIVNNQSSISPGISFIEPLTTATIPLRLSNFPRSFSLGVGGGMTGQALRTETVSFTLAFKEVRQELDNPKAPGNLRYYDYCILPQRNDLNGTLDLKTWVRSALSPLAPPTAPNYAYLTEGHHKPPAGGTPKAGPQAAPRAPDYVPTLEDILKASQNTASYAKLTEDIAAQAASSQPSCTADVLAFSEKAAQEAINASNAAYSAGLAAAKDKDANLRVYYDAAMTAFSNAQDDNDNAQKAYMRCVATASLDPPIDSISHSVQFIVTYSVNASPTWSLVHFKGPGAGSNSLLSGSQTNTHTLVITMGAPAPGTTKQSSSEVLFQRQNQGVNAAIQNLGQQIKPPQ